MDRDPVPPETNGDERDPAAAEEAGRRPHPGGLRVVERRRRRAVAGDRADLDRRPLTVDIGEDVDLPAVDDDVPPDDPGPPPTEEVGGDPLTEPTDGRPV